MMKTKYRKMIKDGENYDSGHGDWVLLLIILLGGIILFKPSTLTDAHPYIHKLIDEPSAIILLLYALTGFTLSYFYAKQLLPIGRRGLFLGITATLGVISFSNSDIKNIEYIHDDLHYLILVLPTFFILWVFRTYDVQRQIDKTQESINNSSFFECAQMLASEELLAPRMALEQLAYLKNETDFDKKRIDYLTRNVNLKDRDLIGARLNNLDLSNAILNEVILDKAILKGTQFGDNIFLAKSLTKAVYNQTTSLPAGLPIDAREMIYEPD